jgi:hypothetical protein
MAESRQTGRPTAAGSRQQQTADCGWPVAAAAD